MLQEISKRTVLPQFVRYHRPFQLSSSMVPHKKPFRREQINLGHLRSGDDQQLWPGDAMESDPRRTDSLAKASLDSLAQKGGYGGLG